MIASGHTPHSGPSSGGGETPCRRARRTASQRSTESERPDGQREHDQRLRQLDPAGEHVGAVDEAVLDVQDEVRRGDERGEQARPVADEGEDPRDEHDEREQLGLGRDDVGRVDRAQRAVEDDAREHDPGDREPARGAAEP